MSQKERVRLTVMKQVHRQELRLTEASEMLGLSYRQTKRVWGRYRLAGDAGLVHASRGRPGLRAKPAQLKARILARYEKRYPDFGPTLAAEYLAGEGLAVDHETLRRWLLAARQADDAPAPPAPSPVARAQALLWGHGAVGWFASRLV